MPPSCTTAVSCSPEAAPSPPGCEGFEAGRMTEFFDPQDRRLELGPTMTEPRAGGTATLLEDGRVLLTGGYPGEGRPATSTAEFSIRSRESSRPSDR